ncbi:hypothetical protein M3J09_004743 [Ascochyta lentis]
MGRLAFGTLENTSKTLLLQYFDHKYPSRRLGRRRIVHQGPITNGSRVAQCARGPGNRARGWKYRLYTMVLTMYAAVC